METDEVVVTLSRVSPPEFAAIVIALREMSNVHHMEEREPAWAEENECCSRRSVYDRETCHCFS